MAIPIERMHISQRMSKIVTYNETIYLCGQVGNRGASIEAQTTEALSRVDALLAEAGSSKKHLLQAVIWLKSMDDFDAMNKVWEAWVPDGAAPARACGRVEMASEELLVEITIIAAKA